MKIVFCTEYGGNYKHIAACTIPVMRKYCERNGYELKILVLEGTGNEYYYEKNKYFKDLFLDDIDAVFYLDVDAIITNHSIKIESFIDDKHHLFITEHLGELNGGALLIMNTEEGRRLNDRILSLRHQFENEQNAINYLMTDESFKKLVKIVPHPSFNSFDYSLYPECPTVRKGEQGHWGYGDFVLHTPGLGIDHRLQVLKNTPIIL